MDHAKSALMETAVLVRISLSANRVRAHLSPDRCPTLYEFVWERRFDSRLAANAFIALPLERKDFVMSAPAGVTKSVFVQIYRCGSSTAKPVVFEDYVRPARRRPDRARFLASQAFWERILTGNVLFRKQQTLDRYLIALFQRYGRLGLPIGLEYREEPGYLFPSLPASLRS